ncbi:MAG: hypothetical protein WAO12_02880 [Venatoribacter sp.]
MEDYPTWRKSEHARFAFSENEQRCQFYALGMSRFFDKDQRPLLAYLANNHVYEGEKLLELAQTEPAQELLVQLFRKQALYE